MCPWPLSSPFHPRDGSCNKAPGLQYVSGYCYSLARTPGHCPRHHAGEGMIRCGPPKNFQAHLASIGTDGNRCTGSQRSAIVSPGMVSTARMELRHDASGMRPIGEIGIGGPGLGKHDGRVQPGQGRGPISPTWSAAAFLGVKGKTRLDTWT